MKDRSKRPVANRVNPLASDPTRTATLRRQIVMEVRRQPISPARVLKVIRAAFAQGVMRHFDDARRGRAANPHAGYQGVREEFLHGVMGRVDSQQVCHELAGRLLADVQQVDEDFAAKHAPSLVLRAFRAGQTEAKR